MAEVQAGGSGRVLMVFNSAMRNGANAIGLRLLRALTEEWGWQSTAVCLHQEGPLLAELAAVTGRRPVHLPLGEIVRHPQRAARVIAGLGAGGAVLNTTISVLLAPVLRSLGIASVGIIHECWQWEEIERFAFGYCRLEGVDATLLGRALRAAACVVAPARIALTPTHLGRAFEAGGPRVETVYNGLPLAALERIRAGLPDRAELREQCGYGPDDIVVFVPGNVEPRKGHDVVVRQILQLRDAGLLPKAVRVLCVGYRSAHIEGPLEAEFVRRVQQFIRTHQLQDIVHLRPSAPDLHRFYGASDLVLLASRNELLPLTLIEARAYGLPVLAPDLGGLGEAITDGVDGLLFAPPVDATVEPDQWFALDRRASIYPPLGQVLTDALANLPALTARLAPAARARNLRQFGETQMLTRYQRLLTQVLPPGEPAGPHLRCGQARP